MWVYYIGYFYGNKITEIISNRNSKLDRSIDKSYEFLKRNRKHTLLISRIIPGIRTIISIIAGVIRINTVEFIGYSFLGITLWNNALIFLGYLIGENIEKIVDYLNKYFLFIIAIAFIYIFFLYLNF